MNSQYLAGFFDGEGSFSIRIRTDKRYKTGVQVLLRIDITQKSRNVLDLIREFAKTGNVYFNSTYKLYQFNIYKIDGLKKFISLIKDEVVVKKEELDKFSRCVEIVSKKGHLKKEGLEEIQKIKIMFRSRN